MQKNNTQQDPLVVSDVFELAGDFNVATRAALTDEQLQRVAVYLNDKLNSVAK
jgi:uncharacterized membrane protein